VIMDAGQLLQRDATGQPSQTAQPAEARPICAASRIQAANDVAWPAEFECAVQRFWADELGWTW